MIVDKYKTKLIITRKNYIVYEDNYMFERKSNLKCNRQGGMFKSIINKTFLEKILYSLAKEDFFRH